MKKETYTIRRMTRKEVESIAIEWAALEGWNPGLHDAHTFYKTDQNGFFVGLLGDKPISCISVVSYDPAYAFLGFYIVDKDFRRKGYGIKLWNTALSYHKEKNIGLDGVVDQQGNYKKSGFKFAYNNIRFEGIVPSSSDLSKNIIPISEVFFEELITYDNGMFPVPRRNFLKNWIKQPDSAAIAFIKNKKIGGYGMIRKCRKGYKIGPLFADSFEIASQLLESLIKPLKPGEYFYMDTPDKNQRALELAEKISMIKVFETARMYTKTEPEIEINKIFGVTTFELG